MVQIFQKEVFNNMENGFLIHNRFLGDQRLFFQFFHQYWEQFVLLQCEISKTITEEHIIETQNLLFQVFQKFLLILDKNCFIKYDVQYILIFFINDKCQLVIQNYQGIIIKIEMIKGEKQHNSAKKILKQKLIKYRNEIKKQSEILIYDGVLTSRSEHIALFNSIKNPIELSPLKKSKNQDYQSYLNIPTSSEDFNIPMRSLTRENIQNLNKKGKIIRLSLNEMNKKKGSAQNIFIPIESIQLSKSESPKSLIYSPSIKSNQGKKLQLRNLLTIRKSKQQQIQRPYDYIRKTVSQQVNRNSHQLQKRKIYSSLKTKSEKNVKKTSVLTLSKKNPEDQGQHQLTQYYTPAYHKQTRSGYIVNEFKPRIRARHFQDNVNLMATIIRKKIHDLKGQQVMQYMKKMGNKKNHYVPTNQIQKIVRQNNELINRNINESKLMKTKIKRTNKSEKKHGIEAK